MEKTHKKLALVALTAFVLEAAVVLTVAMNIGGNMLSPIKAETVNSSVTFSGFANVDGVGTKVSTLHNGGTIKAYTTRAASGVNASLSYQQYMFFAYESNGVENDSKTIGGSARSFAPFQNLSTITATVSNDVYVYYSINGTSFSQKIISANSSKAIDISGAKYLYLQECSGNMCTLSSVTLSYNCVTSKELESIELSGNYDTSFTVGETFNHDGLVVTAHYNDSTSLDVTSEATVSEPDLSTIGEKTVTVSYSDAYGNVSTTYSITVSDSGGYSFLGQYRTTLSAAMYGVVVISNDGTGTYTRYYSSSGNKNGSATFSYSVSNNTISITNYSPTGITTFKLARGSETTNNTGVVTSNSSFTIDLYNASNDATNYTFNIVS